MKVNGQEHKDMGDREERDYVQIIWAHRLGNCALLCKRRSDSERVV